MISKEAQKIIENLRKNDKTVQAKKLTPEQALHSREHIDRSEGDKFEFPKGVTLKRIDKSGVKGELYKINPDERKVLLFIHGGAYANGTVYSRRKTAVQLGIATNVDTFSVDYRQFPEGRHPDGQNDVVNAYEFLRQNYDKVYVFGESAGATFVLTLTLQLKAEGKQLPDKLSVFSPVINQLNTSASEYLRNDRDPMLMGGTPPMPYFEEPAKKDPLISPIYGDYKGFPKIQINCGSEEVKYDSSAILNKLCQDAGVDVQWKVWNGLFHVFVLFDMPESTEAIREIGDFFRK